MGKWLHRIFRNELQQRLPSLIGRTIHIQLNDGRTIVGVLQEASGKSPIKLTDFLGRKHSFEWQAVDEAIFDEVRK